MTIQNEDLIESTIIGLPEINSNEKNESMNLPKASKKIAISCYMTGIFAMVGALYCWGDGPIFNAPIDVNLSLYIAELLVCGPLSFIAGYGYSKMKGWGLFAGLIVTGIYVYGSAMVYASLFLVGPPYPLELIIPPIFGIILSIGIIKWSWNNLSFFIFKERN